MGEPLPGQDPSEKKTKEGRNEIIPFCTGR